MKKLAIVAVIALIVVTGLTVQYYDYRARVVSCVKWEHAKSVAWFVFGGAVIGAASVLTSGAVGSMVILSTANTARIASTAASGGVLGLPFTVTQHDKYVDRCIKKTSFF